MEQGPNLISKKVDNSPDKKQQSMVGVSLDEKRKRYIVRLAHEDGAPLIQKEFSFRGKNTQEQALEEAIKFRNEQVRDFLLPCTKTREGVEYKNNQTGVVGINRREKIRKNGEKAGIYVATWYNEENKLERMEFTEKKWGAKQAFFMAWATRINKKRIFKTRINKTDNLISADRCFDITYDVIGKEQAEKIWEKEKERVENIETEIKKYF